MFRTVAQAGVRQPSVSTPSMGDRIPEKARAPGTWGLAAIANDRGCLSPRGPLASPVVEGERLSMGLPAVLPTPPLPTIHDDEPTGSRTLARSAMEPE